MSGFNTGSDNSSNAYVGIYGSSLPSALMSLLQQEAFAPGAKPDYETCKIMYAYHPLAPSLVDKPVDLALSQEREYAIPGQIEDVLTEAFKKTWRKLGGVGGNEIVARVGQISRIYGIATLFVGAVSKQTGEIYPTDEPLPWDDIDNYTLYFNILDPLNTSGSLVLNQDPNAPDFLKPLSVSVAGKVYHPSRTVIIQNEQPIYIQYTDSAFGFVGRSVFQRAFFPLKSYILSMITNDKVQEKAMLLVAKLKQPGGMLDNRAVQFFMGKREAIKGAMTGNVLSIGIDEELQSLDLKNLREAAEYSRTCIIKDIASSSGTPAILINQETLTEGFGEGSEDAKQIANFVQGERNRLNPAFAMLDEIVMRLAWTPALLEKLKELSPDQYSDMSFETFWYECRDSFVATWPNLLSEPESEKAKGDQSKLESAVKIAEQLMKSADPVNKAAIAAWLADFVNTLPQFDAAPLLIDEDAMASYVPPIPMAPDAQSSE